MLAQESAATMMSLSKMKESVVVPFLWFTISLAAFWNPSKCVECGELEGELVGGEEATELVAAWCGGTEVVLESRECQAPSIWTSIDG